MLGGGFGLGLLKATGHIDSHLETDPSGLSAERNTRTAAPIAGYLSVMNWGCRVVAGGSCRLLQLEAQ